MGEKLKGKIALVTGASRRIGKAIALNFATEGADVVCAASRKENVTEVVKAIKNIGKRAIALSADMNNINEATNMIEIAENKMGPLDILVNNAGTAVLKNMLYLNEKEWDGVMNVNLKSIFFSSQRAALSMKKNGKKGVIINIGSIAGINAFPDRSVYGVSKAALHHLTKIMAIDLASINIRVNCIAPGYIEHNENTEFVKKGLLDLEALKKRILLNCIGEGKDIANAAIYLASDDAKYVTGSILTVDGGFTAYGFI